MERAWLGSLVEQAPDGLWLIDGDGRTLYANPRMQELVGRSLDQLRATPVEELLDDAGREDWRRHCEVARAGHPGEHNVESLVHRVDGTPIWTLASWKPVHLEGGPGNGSEEGPVRAWLYRITEYTDRRELVESLRNHEHQLVRAQELARLGSWEWDVVSDRITWSEELHRICGIGPEEFGATFAALLEMYHPDDRAEVDRINSAALATGADFGWQARLVRPDGQVRWIRCHGAVELEDGRPRRTTGTAQDVTERVEAESRLAENARRLRMLQQTAVAANRASTLVEAMGLVADTVTENSGYHPLTAYLPGKKPGELVMLRRWIEAPDGQARELDAALARRSFETGEVQVALTPEAWPGRSLVSMPVRCYEKVACVVTVLADEVDPDAEAHMLIAQIGEQLRRVAEREHDAVALAEARDAAMESARLKTEFLANMSHEIRTPMNGVIGLNDLLLRTQLDDRQRELAEGIREAGLTLLELINDVLDLSKIEAGKLELESEDFDVRAVLERSAGILARPAADKGLELVVAVDPEVPMLLNGDAMRLGQVLTNLGSNAVKFTESGEVAVHAGVLDTDEHGNLTLWVTVRDTGIGIDPADVDGLFDAFVQADRSTTRRHGGTGLGLAISRQLVAALGGEIGVDSTPGSGSTFWFTARFQAARSARQELPAGPVASLRGTRVLVVDDNATLRETLVRQLTAWGIRVDAVDSGDDAMRTVTGRPPYDAVLLDLGLDAGAGAELRDRLCESHPGRVISMSADSTRIGPVLTISKPVRHSALLDALLLAVAGEAPAPVAEPSGRPQASGVRALVVEDNRVNQLVAAGLLESLGCTVDVLADGTEAVRALTGDHDYDFVLMDCRMPRMDGYDATRIVRAREGDRRVPIIALTASVMEGERERCLEAGMDDFLTKPVDPPQLARALRRWVPAARRVEEPAAPACDGASNGVLDGVLDPARVEMLRELVEDGVSFFERTRTSFLGRVDDLVADLVRAHEAGDRDRVIEVSHQLKGSALNIGLVELGTAAGAVEDRARGETSGEVPDLAELVAACAGAVDRAVDALVDVPA